MTNGNGRSSAIDNPVQIRASDDELARVQDIADYGEQLWIVVGDLKQQHEQDAAAEGVRCDYMRWYADIGTAARKSRHTIAQYCSLYERARDVLPEFDGAGFGVAHWRLFAAQATATGAALRDVVQRWAESADDYGGRPVPVDVVAARLADAGAEPAVTRWERALERLQKALGAALRCAPEGAAPELAQVSAALARLEEAG